jgi:hypothetical protein
MLKICTLLLTSLLITACGKAPSMDAYTSKSVHSLTGKSKEEILRLKYNNRISLNCKIRLSNGQKVYIKNGFADEFTWSLTEELSMLRVLNYLTDDEMVIVVKMADKVKIEDQLSHRGENGREYYNGTHSCFKNSLSKGLKRYTV